MIDKLLQLQRQDKLNEIANILQYWLDHQKAQRDLLSITTSDLTHLIQPPSWPTRGTLKEWIKILRGE